MMEKLNPWVAGVTLALTLAIMYSVCAAAMALWPDATLSFFNAWFHGVDLRMLKPAAGAFAIGIFFYGLSAITVTGFTVGAVYAAIYNLVRRCPGCQSHAGH